VSIKKQVENMKYSINIFLAVVLTLIISSCGKSVNEPVPQHPSSGKLAKVSFGGGYSDSFYYRQDGKLDKIIIFSETGGTTYKEVYLFSYNSSGKVASVQIENGDEFRYAYVNDQVAAVSRYENGVKMSYKFINYVGQGTRLESIEDYEKTSPGALGFAYTFKQEYTYHNDGNLKEEIRYQINQNGQATKYQTTRYDNYDQHLNVDNTFRYFLYLSGVHITVNNPTKITRRDEIAGSEQVYNYQFIYNGKAAPVKRTMSTGPVGSVETELTYSYY
jgi:hypothetical protein